MAAGEGSSWMVVNKGGQGGGKEASGEVEINQDLYSRQIGTYGMETMGRYSVCVSDGKTRKR